MLKTGLDVKLAKTLDLAAVIHIQRLANGSLQFTAVPLLYGNYALKQGAGTFSLQPPPGINLVAGLPIVAGRRWTRRSSFTRNTSGRTPGSTALDQPMATPAASSSAAPATELVRVNATPAAEISLPMRRKGHGLPTPGVAIASRAPPPPTPWLPRSRRRP